MNSEYYELTSELDAREVLRYLNNLGIQNINGEVLKYFITDLKKLIKFDLQNRNNKFEAKEGEILWSERLHSASTFSSRVRSRIQEKPQICSKQCAKPRRPYILRNTQSAPNIGVTKTDEVKKPDRRACSCVMSERKPEVLKEKNVCSSSNSISNIYLAGAQQVYASSRRWPQTLMDVCNTRGIAMIKVPRQLPQKKCDPVALYHYYTSLWSKYKPNVPGENDWADLRWKVRQKMVGNEPKQTHNKVSQDVRKK